jgi:hypothetical protein
MKCDGVKIADEWGCEEPINTGPLFVVEELTMEQVSTFWLLWLL